MIRIIKSTKILIPILGLLFVLPLVYDLFKFFSEVNIVPADYAVEFLIIIFTFIYYRFLQNKFNLQIKTIQENLKLFVYLLGALYLVIIIASIILTPSYSKAIFPYPPETLSSVIYSNLLSISAIIFLVPILIIFKNLIYYRRTSRTIFFMRALVISSLICIVISVITRLPLSFSFEGVEVYSNSFLVLSTIWIILISFRNSWITYSTRNEKVTYFFISLFLIFASLYLSDFFEVALATHSLAVNTFFYISWLFIVIYIIFCSFYLLIQLPTARVFDRKMKEVASLHNLSKTISAEFDFNKLVKLITDMTAEVIDSESTWLELQRSNPGDFYIAASHNLLPSEIDKFQKREKRELSEDILIKKKAIIINEITKHASYKYVKSLKSDIGSIIGVPLISGNGEAIGILFATKKQSFGFDPDDLAMLEAYANQAVIALDNAKLLKQSFERERLEEELRIARDVQQRLLPQKKPKYKGVSIESLTITAYEVGGDYYDFIKLPDEHLGFIIGDVSGKGTSAAFYMAEAKGIVQSLSKTFHKPRDLMIKTNEILYETLERKLFISMLMASLDCKNRTISFVRAGHCPLLHFNAKEGKSKLLQPKGIGVGLEKGVIFKKTLEEQTLSCEKDDIFVFYTDGLSEARNGKGEEYGDDRLCELICENAEKSVSDLKETIIDSILSFLDGRNLEDDLTLLLVKT